MSSLGQSVECAEELAEMGMKGSGLPSGRYRRDGRETVCKMAAMIDSVLCNYVHERSPPLCRLPLIPASGCGQWSDSKCEARRGCDGLCLLLLPSFAAGNMSNTICPLEDKGFLGGRAQWP